eukprot:GHVR01049507.1.p2 GENE.GHVR01049507.1~~GHVR01049507.1.p2  ORF type:complete len:245 (+),score=87.77 GHVR01049507.1:103-837(+)
MEISTSGVKRKAVDADICDIERLPFDINQEQLTKILDEADSMHVETLNAQTLKRVVAQLDRKIKRNQEMRIKHPDEPEKFLKSEVDLAEEIKKISQIAALPDLYDEFVSLGGLQKLVALLAHVNTDVSVEVARVMSEMTEGDGIADPEAFCNSLMECQLAELVVDTLARINEEASDDDYQAVTDTLQVIENVIEMHPPSAVRFAKEKLLTWLFKRVRGGKQVGANTHTHTHTHKTPIRLMRLSL